jgi:hypothetical protein
MELLDHMLALESRLERPDLMLLMVQHWMQIRDETKEGSIITCTIFPTTIAHKLKIDVPDYLTIPHSSCFDLKSLIECRSIRKTLDNGPLDPDVYLWKLEYMLDMLPIYAPISFDCHETWRLEVIDIPSDEE